MIITKKVISVFLCFVMLFGSAVSLCAVNASAQDEWTTVSYSCRDLGNTTYTVFAKGNDIKIVIKSSYINGDKLFCAGRGNEETTEIFDVVFSDSKTDDKNANQIKFFVLDHGSKPHYSSIRDVNFFLEYHYYIDYVFTDEHFLDGTDNFFGPIGTYYDPEGKPVVDDYQGVLSLNGCKKLNISTEGNTMTVTATLPDTTMCNFPPAEAEIKFDSDNLTIIEPQADNSSALGKIIAEVKAFFLNIFDYLRKLFTFDF